MICGEIGGSAEEQAAEYAAGMAKPVVAFVAGRASPPGKKMGHAGAIVSGGKGNYRSKRRALEQAGVAVADVPSDVPELLSPSTADRAVGLPTPVAGQNIACGNQRTTPGKAVKPAIRSNDMATNGPVPRNMSPISTSLAICFRM